MYGTASAVRRILPRRPTDRKIKPAPPAPAVQLQRPFAAKKFYMQITVSLLVVGFSMVIIWKRPEKDNSVSYSLISSIVGFWLPTPVAPKHEAAAAKTTAGTNEEEDEEEDDEENDEEDGAGETVLQQSVSL